LTLLPTVPVVTGVEALDEAGAEELELW